MTGEYQHSLDSKGRLFIPAKLRDELGEVFFITISMDRCLCAYSSESWQILSERVNAMPYVKPKGAPLSRRICASMPALRKT